MFGYWDALYFVFIFIIGLILAWLLERWAAKSGMGTREVGEGTKIFISGEDPDKVILGFEHLEGHYTGRNVMWGLTYSLKKPLSAFQREHTGLLTDYAGYLIITAAFVIAVVLIWG
ncbi:hydrogenase [Thermococcus sp. CX2]|uniref:hydrogenase n=1 Tax=Thermococcus sp. CX2 TaxID=163006 RepID=UPI001438FE8D|nr:hydrogenase [Thermococcus sp. CX2]NJE85388.1 hydrogenase [Thermococcus sp. CX2]